MKKLLIICAVLLCTGASAQDSLRNFLLLARTPKGKVVPELELTARLKRDSGAVTLDRFGNRYFKVTDADTLIVDAEGSLYAAPLKGLDSLEFVFKSNRKFSGIRYDDIILDIGYGNITKANATTSIGHFDMKDAENYPDLRRYMEGRVAGVSFSNGKLVVRGGSEPLIIIDGVEVPDFATANAMVNPGDVESISVLNDSGGVIYGLRGGGGVVIITTKVVRDRNTDRK